MADLRHPVVVLGGVSVVDAPQQIAAADAESFRKLLLREAGRGHTPVVVSMTRTRFCDLAGVAALAWAHGLTVANGRELLLVTPASPAVLRVLTLAGLDHFIPHFAHLTEALDHAHALVPRHLHRAAPPRAAS